MEQSIEGKIVHVNEDPRMLIFVCLPFFHKLVKPGLQKGSWTKDEDQVVKSMVMDIGVAKVKWSYVAEHVSVKSAKCAVPRHAYLTVSRCRLALSCLDASASSAESAGSITSIPPSRKGTGPERKR